MIYGLKRAFEKAENDAIAVVKMLIVGKNVDEIATAINLSLQEVLYIKEEFEFPLIRG
ncbi:hypothetical protein ACUXCC_004902 [Cytobacillus horneckiae]|uniref:hypothetical protein n=1 Tax=Cytobacillus horneckiae TaxID=549687 RepID=UPI0019CF995D|nr:hypothetical protein [Cytobacillus horneckiae]MBN6889597.1 hypothetical protein [Cytobacillus horneckiae]MCM3180931.1 hypothetical protein [Cytobacillus horneckiae]